MAENRAKQDDDELAIDLHNNTMTGEWEKVVDMYEEHQTKAISARINKSGDTALHVAVSNAPEDIVRKLVSVITKVSEFGLWTKNNIGNTPLHVAASTGKFFICILLGRALRGSHEVQDLVLKDLFHNNFGESPHFLATSHGHKPNFLYLESLCPSPDLKQGQSNPLYRRKNGDTILHCAISWEYFDLAFEILELDHTLAYSVNELGITPLHLLASTWVKELKKETATEELVSSVEEKYRRSSWLKFQKGCQECIYPIWKMARVVTTRCRDLLKKKIKRGGDKDVESAKSEQEGPPACSEDQAFQRWFSKYSDILFDLGDNILFISGYKFIHNLLKGQASVVWEHQQEPSAVQATDPSATASKTDQQHKSNGTETDSEKKENEKGKKETPKMEEIETAILLAAQNGITDTVKKILKEIPMAINVKREGKEEKIETPTLLAAKNGITEMVEKILKEIPMAINDESNNVVLLAAKNRQTHVLRVLFKHDFVKCKLIHEVDANGNNALHLAAELGEQEPWVIPGAALQMQWEIKWVLFKHDFVKCKLIHEVDANGNNALHLAAELGEQEPWVIPGAALQMQWEIKWYEFVKNNMPEHFRYQHNQDKMTPDEIFNRTHVELVKQGSEWLNKTSESCSVVAALIVTVAFAASTTIPGNIDEKIGKPNLEDRSGLSIFAYSSLIALFFSTTALFSFLSILTDRYKQKDFHFKLPIRILIGLSALFISIVSMLVSFSAGHSFMLENKLRDKTFNVYAGLTCLPIICFILQQLPLYLDYAMANLHEVPPSSYKAITL
nr:ankyrin repeat-containing protein [Quercus suber]